MRVPHTCSDAFHLPSAQLQEPGPRVSPLLGETVKVQVPHPPRLTWPSHLQRVSYLCICPASMELIHGGKVRPGHCTRGRPDLAYLLRTLAEAGASVCPVVGRARSAHMWKHPNPTANKEQRHQGEEAQKARGQPGRPEQHCLRGVDSGSALAAWVTYPL